MYEPAPTSSAYRPRNTASKIMSGHSLAPWASAKLIKSRQMSGGSQPSSAVTARMVLRTFMPGSLFGFCGFLIASDKFGGPDRNIFEHVSILAPLDGPFPIAAFILDERLGDLIAVDDP